MARRGRDGALPLEALAEFRYQLRRFLVFSEAAAAGMGLPAQQHQLLLQVAGARAGVEVTVAYVAERLGLRHHSVVELSLRCESAGLIVRRASAADRRRVVLEVAPEGARILAALSEHHARELRELGPGLIDALERIGARYGDEERSGRG